MVDRPRYLQEGEQRLRKQQRRLARKRRGSHRYHRQRERVARAHARVRQQRRWFAHQLSHDLAQRFDLVSFEGLDASELIEGNPLAKGLSDAGWGMLREMTAYKEAVRSGRCVQVESRGTTQCCSQCSRWADPPLTLEDHTYSCPCGYVADRDGNAARNILARGMTLLSKELRRSTAEVTRVENGPTPARGDRRVYQGRRARSRKREHGIEVGTPFSDSPVRARVRVGTKLVNCYESSNTLFCLGPSVCSGSYGRERVDRRLGREDTRPRTLGDMVGQEGIVPLLQAYAQKRSLPHLLFADRPGTGKTTAALALARDLFGEEWRQNFLELNASDERGIETVRQRRSRRYARSAPIGDWASSFSSSMSPTISPPRPRDPCEG